MIMLEGWGGENGHVREVASLMGVRMVMLQRCSV